MLQCDVLVVEDDDAIREALCELLQDEGYAVETAVHGGDALRQLRAGLRTTMILLDWKMPVMNGAQFWAAQQRDPYIAEIPVAVLSAHAYEDLRSQAAVDAVLRKPVDFNALLRTVERFCSI